MDAALYVGWYNNVVGKLDSALDTIPNYPDTMLVRNLVLAPLHDEGLGPLLWAEFREREMHDPSLRAQLAIFTIQHGDDALTMAQAKLCHAFRDYLLVVP